MKDLMSHLRMCKTINKYDIHRIISFCNNYLRDIIIDWDEFSGENWVMFVKGNDKVAILNVEIPITFVLYEHLVDFKKINEIDKSTLIPIKDFEEKNWCINLHEFKSVFPNLGWNASIWSVDPSNLSINDFWYATV